MQTTEDRLTAVERQLATLTRVLTEQQLSLRDIEKNETILLGLASGQERATKDIQARLETMDGKLDAILARLESRPE